MKKIVVLAVAVLAVVGVLAQDAPKPEGGAVPHRVGGHPPFGPGGMMQNAWVARVLSSRENLAKIGVTDAAVCDKLIGELTAIREKSDALEKQVRGISREQAQLMRELMDDKSKDAKPVLDKIDEVAKLRAEQGRLAVKAILIARDNLSEEQLKQARSLIRERGFQRGRMRRGEGGRPEGGHHGPNGKRAKKPQQPES